MLLKVKTWQDAEGLVIGHEPGCGKYEGMMGSLIVRWGSVVFRLSGFTDAERLENWIGRTVTFKYRELTRDGVPKEARYWRKWTV
jgi:DNA ligase-1